MQIQKHLQCYFFKRQNKTKTTKSVPSLNSPFLIKISKANHRRTILKYAMARQGRLQNLISDSTLCKPFFRNLSQKL